MLNLLKNWKPQQKNNRENPNPIGFNVAEYMFCKNWFAWSSDQFPIVAIGSRFPLVEYSINTFDPNEGILQVIQIVESADHLFANTEIEYQ